MDNQLIQKTQRAIDGFERVPDGQPYAAALAEATRLLEELAGAARAAIFPRDLAPIDVAVLYDLENLTGGMSTLNMARELAGLHEQCLASYPALAAAIRGDRGHRLLLFALGRHLDIDIPAHVDAFERQVAAQLAARKLDLPSSEVLSTTVPQLRARIVAEQQRREALTAAVLVAADAERAEVARVVDQARKDRRQQLIERARNLPGVILVTLGNMIGDRDEWTGPTLAGALNEVDNEETLARVADALEGAEAQLVARLRRAQG